MVGAHLGFTDTPMVAHLDVEKGAPDEIVRNILDSLEAGASEALADEITVQVRAGLSNSTTGAM